MTFTLDKNCQQVTDAPLHIFALQAQKISDGTVVSQAGFAFQWNAEAKVFDIYAATIQPGHNLAHTKITTAKTGEVVTIVVVAEDKKIIKANLTKKDGTERSFSASQSLPAAQVKLVGKTPEKHASGAAATFNWRTVAPGGTPATAPTMKTPAVKE